MRTAVFLDRDGTINEQMGYINHITRFIMLPRTAEAIRLLNDSKVPVVVVTNQSGIARGYFPESLLHGVHAKMKRLLGEKGAHVDGIYVCPHHPEAKEARYRLACKCRKPLVGMFTEAAKDLDVDLARSYVIGDRWTDIKAAAACKAKGILVLTGYGRGDRDHIGPREAVQPVHVAEDLFDAACWVLRDIRAR